MNTVPAGKKPVKKIPRARRSTAPTDAMLSAATRLRKLIRQRLHLSNEDVRGLFALDEYADRVIRRVNYQAAMDCDEPTPAEVAYQHRVYHEAMMHFATFHTLLSGLVDTGTTVRWAGGFESLRLMWASELLGSELAEFRDEMVKASAIDNALLFEQSVRLAVERIIVLPNSHGG